MNKWAMMPVGNHVQNHRVWCAESKQASPSRRGRYIRIKEIKSKAQHLKKYR